MPIKNIKTVSYRSSDKFGSPIPSIQLQGKFLNKLNFPVSSKYKVEYSNNFIHISKILQDRFGDIGLASNVVRK